METEIFLLDNYLFSSAAEFELAQKEKQKVQYLEEHTDYRSLDSVVLLYKKLIDQTVFQTPVGYDYLNKLHYYLVSKGISSETLPGIPVYSMRLSRNVKDSGKGSKLVQRQMASKTKWLRISVVINIVLAILVATMFVITLKSDNPNIINYEKALINKYSAWEQEISDREAAVREKEYELNLEE